MKKILAWALVLLMVVGLFAGCTNEPKPTDPSVGTPTDPVVEDNSANLASAMEYLETMYKTVGEITGKDFTRPSSIPYGLDRYEITWTTNTDQVKVVDNGDGTVTIDVNEAAEADTPYELTATMADGNGKTVSYTWKHLLPKAVDVSEIFTEAFALADGESMGYEVTLTGVVTMVNTAYSPDYKNVTVTIEVPGYEDKAIQCYRMKGDGADQVGPGWTITVTGTLTNYKGTVQFGAGCIMDSYVVGEGAKAPEDPLQIVSEAYALADGASLPYTATLTGVITGIDTPYDPGYGNVTVTIAVAGAENSPIMCYRLKGTGADDLYVGDIITVKGLIKNYKGTIEFDAGCQLLEVIPGERVAAPTDPYEILDAAYALKRDESLPWPVTLTGIVTTVDDPYSEEYNNITVTITLPGANDQPIKCYRMKGDGIAKIKPSDTITVTGVITNYEGEREFKAGCQMIAVVERGPGYHAPETQEEIVDHAMNLPITCTLLYKAKLTGVISKINTAYSASYGNITVTIDVKDSAGQTQKMELYRMTGDGIKNLKVGDQVTAEGYITHYVISWKEPIYSKIQMVKPVMTWTNAEAAPEPEVPEEVEGTKVAEVVIYNPDSGKALSANPSRDGSYYNGGVDVTVNGTTVTGYGATEIWDLIQNEDGTYSFANGGKKLSMDVEFSSTPFDKAHKTWKVTPAGTDTYTIENVGRAGQKLQWRAGSSYNYFSCYTGSGAAYEFAFHVVSGTLPEFGGTVTPDPEPETGLGAEITNPNVDPTASLKVVIYAPAYAKALSTQKTGYNNYYNLGVDVAAGASGLTGYSDTEVWDVIDNGDGTYSFANGGKKIGLAASNSSMNLDTVNDTWTVEALGGGLYNLKNVGRGNYMEWYAEKENWSTYGTSSAATDDQFQVAFYVVAGTLPTFGGTTTPDPEPEDPTPDPEPETPMTEKEIVDAAFALTGSESLDDVTLTGTIVSVDTAYDSNYKNITVTMEVEGTSGKKTLKCFRLTGDDLTIVAALKVTDTITVNGNIVLYSGNPQFGQGCKLTGYVEGPGEVVPEDALVIVIADIATENSWANSTKYDGFTKEGVSFTASCTNPSSYGQNTGKYYTNGQNWRFYQNENPSLVIDAGTKTIATIKFTYGNSNTGILTYGGQNVTTGSVLEVNASTATFSVGNTGTATNGNVQISKIEITFAAGGTTPDQPGDDTEPETPTYNSFAEMVEAANGLANNALLGVNITKTGVVANVPSYNSSFNSWTFNITIEGTTLKCHSMEVAGTTDLKQGDTVQIVGDLSAYNGAAQFNYNSATATWISGSTTPDQPGDDTGTTTTLTYDLTKVGSGTQYAEETYTLDDNTVLKTTDCHVTSQLRIYYDANNGYYGNAVFESAKVIKSVSFVHFTTKTSASAKVYGSVDGSSWDLLDTVSITGSDGTSTIDTSAKAYKYVKIEAVDKQIRLKSLSMDVV